MSAIEDRLADYRSLRDSSRKVLMADIKHARSAYTINGLTSRYLGGVTEGARDVYEVAKIHTVDNRGVIAIVLGALALWFGREPLLDALSEDLPEDDPASENAQSDDLAPEPASCVQQSETDIPPESPYSGDTNDL